MFKVAKLQRHGDTTQHMLNKVLSIVFFLSLAQIPVSLEILPLCSEVEELSMIQHI